MPRRGDQGGPGQAKIDDARVGPGVPIVSSRIGACRQRLQLLGERRRHLQQRKHVRAPGRICGVAGDGFGHLVERQHLARQIRRHQPHGQAIDHVLIERLQVRNFDRCVRQSDVSAADVLGE